MEVRYEILLIIIACGFVTLLPRVIPILFLSKFNLPKWYREWLSFIPVTLMSALIGRELIPIGSTTIEYLPVFWASIVSLFVALRTSSLFMTVGSGILSILLFSNV